VASRSLPVRPSLEQLEHQAKDLLRELKASAPTSRFADAQHTLAHEYGVRSWPRLVLACRLIDAIWNDDLDRVRDLVRTHPRLMNEDARGTSVTGNWGPPLSYAANIGRGRIVTLLRDFGASDVQFAFDRACLQGQLETAQQLIDMGARPEPRSILGPCESLNAAGLEFLLRLGAPLDDRLAPAAMILETYSRRPDDKHRCLELLAEFGIRLPDTAPMAVHRGRIDLLERHLQRDRRALERTYTHAEIYPPELGCHADHSLALHGTPLAGGTLLHLCVDFDELALARWLLNRGTNPNAVAAVDTTGFGGHTALFGCVVSQPYRVGLRRDDVVARLLLDAGADPSRTASLRKRLRFVADETEHLYYNVTARAWGEQFHDQEWVNQAALRRVIDRTRPA
jgi:hypothetical protein